MDKKIALLGLVVLSILVCTSLVSAYTPYKYYTSYYTGYTYQPARVGGFFGANSAYIIGLRPGTYYQTPYVQSLGTYYQTARVGGWFGYYPYGSYYGVRSGTFTFGNYGYGGYNYANVPYVYHGPL